MDIFEPVPLFKVSGSGLYHPEKNIDADGWTCIELLPAILVKVEISPGESPIVKQRTDYSNGIAVFDEPDDVVASAISGYLPALPAGENIVFVWGAEIKGNPFGLPTIQCAKYSEMVASQNYVQPKYDTIKSFLENNGSPFHPTGNTPLGLLWWSEDNHITYVESRKFILKESKNKSKPRIITDTNLNSDADFDQNIIDEKYDEEPFLKRILNKMQERKQKPKRRIDPKELEGKTVGYFLQGDIPDITTPIIVDSSGRRVDIAKVQNRPPV